MSKNNFITFTFDDLHLLFVALYYARSSFSQDEGRDLNISDLRLDVHTDGSGFVRYGNHRWSFDWRCK